MRKDEFRDIQLLFDAAIKLYGSERKAFLEGSCAERPGLQQTIEELIEEFERTVLQDNRILGQEPVFSAGDLVAGRFLIQRLMDSGGMGEVYEAVDTSLRDGIKIALKTIRQGLGNERQAIERFKREVWVAREMIHPGICRVHDLVEHKFTAPDGTAKTIPCLTMRLLEGQNLAAYLSSQGPLTPEVALPIIRQLAECIQAIHNFQIIHRDIKPTNIMLVPRAGGQHQVILIDFGLAKPTVSRANDWNTVTELQPGAPYFMAPECWLGEQVGPAADIYSLGVVIDNMVTSRPAWTYQQLEELQWRKLRERPHLPSARAERLPSVWDRVILRCLERDPGKRPASALQVFEELEHATPIGWLETAGEALRRAVPDLHLPVYSRRKWIAVVIAAISTAVWASFRKSGTGAQASILVLPFENITGRNGDYQPLCLSATEEVRRGLANIKGLDVFEGPSGWDPEPAQLEKVRFLLRGILVDYDGTARLAVKLSDVKMNRVIWSESFDSTTKDLFKFDRLLVSKTVDHLKENLQPGWDIFTLFAAPPAVGTTNKDAFYNYQQGRAYWQQRTLKSALKAVEAYNAAIAIDPNYALAYAALADVQQTLLIFGHGSTRRLMSDAVEYAEVAISLDPSLPECHLARAAAKQNLWEWAESEASYKLAIEKHPKFARAHHWYAGLRMQFADYKSALQRCQHGLELQPYDFASWSNLGLFLWYAGRSSDAVHQLRTVLANNNLLYAHVVLGEVYAHMASQAAEPDATTYFNKSMEQAGLVRAHELSDSGGADPMFLKWSDSMYARAYASRDDFASAENYSTRLRQGFESRKLPATVLAWVYAAQKRWGDTLDMLEYGVENQEREMLYVRVHPLFRPLETNSRYRSVLKKMRLV